MVSLFVSCIQTDFQDPFAPTLRIDNAIDEIEFRVAQSYTLVAIYTDDTGEPASASLQWSSSDPEIISLAGNTATVHKIGEVILKVSTGTLEDQITLETLPSRGSLQISGYTPVMQEGSEVPFHFNFINADGLTDNAIEPIWNSSNTAVATIDQNGSILAVSSGTTSISATFDGVSGAVELQVQEDEVQADPVIRIVSFASFLRAGESFQFEAIYYGSNGLPSTENVIIWDSQNSSIVSIDQEGLAFGGILGSTKLTANFGNTIATTDVIVEESDTELRSGSLRGTGYDISGDFTLALNENDELILTITDYRPDGPGPYFYLVNQSTNVANGINLGEGKTGGNVQINVTAIDETAELNTYDYLMVWCEPFNVRLAVGELSN